MKDTSTFVGNSGRQVEQVEGDASGYAAYLQAYEKAENKCEFNANLLSIPLTKPTPQVE